MSSPHHNQGRRGSGRGTGAGGSSTNPLNMSDGDLAAAGMDAECAAVQNSALLRAHAAQHAAIIARHQQEAAIRQASMEANWLGATAAAAASTQSQQNSNMTAAENAASQQQRRASTTGTENALNGATANSGTATSGGNENIIPIGFFRDPRGNAWAATLQHPQQASLLMRLQQQHQRAVSAAAVEGGGGNDGPLADVYQHAARQAILTAQQQTRLRGQNQAQQQVQHQQQHHQAMINLQNKSKINNKQNEIIEIDSDDDEEDDVQVTMEDAEEDNNFVPSDSLRARPPSQATTELQRYDAAAQQRIRAQKYQAAVAAASRKEIQRVVNDKKIAIVAAKAKAAATAPSLAAAARKRALQIQSTTGRPSAGAATAARHDKKRRTNAAAAPMPNSGDYDAIMRERHERARKLALEQRIAAPTRIVAPPAPATSTTHGSNANVTTNAAATSGNSSLIGPFVHKWLSNSAMSIVDKDQQLRDIINKVLMAATGYSMESAPASLPFPPAEINLDMDQLEELALELVNNRHAAIGESIRRAYSEIKSRHDEVVIHREQRSEERNQHRREVSMLTLRHKNVVGGIERQHKTDMAEMKNKVEEMEEAVKAAKESVSKVKETQAKTLETMMKASILSLRMIRKKEKEQPSSEEELQDLQ